MDFRITKLGDTCFLISAQAGTIPKASPGLVSEVIGQIKRDFQISPSTVRFFWPQGDQVDTVIALLPRNN